MNYFALTASVKTENDSYAYGYKTHNAKISIFYEGILIYATILVTVLVPILPA